MAHSTPHRQHSQATRSYVESAATPQPLGDARLVAALYVETSGVYADLAGVDVWDEHRDARRYPGPHPVVAHPPCARWGRYWFGSPRHRQRLTLGDDAGCFAAALAAVRRWGGVLEHPEGSHAWAHHDLNRPPRWGHWVAADALGGWTCCVEQGHYAHKARKATWLYVYGMDPPELVWRPSKATMRLEAFNKRERARTPAPFRDLLLSMARSVRLDA